MFVVRAGYVESKKKGGKLRVVSGFLFRLLWFSSPVECADANDDYGYDYCDY